MKIIKKLIKYGLIWRKGMFKKEFNSVYVAVKDFILEEKIIPEFDNPTTQLKYYRSKVDEYNDTVFLLEQLKKKSQSMQLTNELDTIMVQLTDAFNKYKDNFSIVRLYLDELKVLDKKNTFIEQLYRFEQKLVSVPIVKVDVEEIQRILTVGREYASNGINLYYYSNNPYEINEYYGVVIPVKHSFDNSEKMLTSVYNYMYGLYTRYLRENKQELDSMVILEKNIENKIYELRDVYSKAIKTKIVVDVDTFPKEYYAKVEELNKIFSTYKNIIINLGVDRFTKLMFLFNSTCTDIDNFISEYKRNELYLAYMYELEFDNDITKLAEYICLFEDGKVNASTEYIITDSTIKNLVEKIIKVAKIVRKKITYTQKYHETGYPTKLEFEFYQTELFLESVKAYYYRLMMDNSSRYMKMNIDDFGDETITDLRQKFKNSVAAYNSFLEKEVDYINDVEFIGYKNEVVDIQRKLKKAAISFYDAAVKTSPPTYTKIIEQHYSTLLKKMENDLYFVDSRRTVDVFKLYSPEKVEADKKIKFIGTHLSDLLVIKQQASKNVFVGLEDFIDTYLYVPLNTIFKKMCLSFNAGDNLTVLNIYDEYYSTNVLDFNTLYALKKFSYSAKQIFDLVDFCDLMYVNEITSDSIVSEHENIMILDDLFGDDTYKVSRNELFGELDMLYEFIGAIRKNEHIFLTNEKNLKKLYFDAQLVKMNYIRWYHHILNMYIKYKGVDVHLLLGDEKYLINKKIIDSFDYLEKLKLLIVSQNKILAGISRMLTEYKVDNIQASNNVLAHDSLKVIDSYNSKLATEFKIFNNAIDIITCLSRVKELDAKKEKLVDLHKTQWVSIIENNNINDPEVISYNEMETFKGTVPYTVKLKAKPEISVDVTGKEIISHYTWYIDGDIKDGSEVMHTFYKEGKYDVRCDQIIDGGEILSRHLSFDLSGQTNSQMIKNDIEEYKPTHIDQSIPKITYVDPVTGQLLTLPISITGSIADAMENGTLSFSPNGDLLTDKAGLVILGFEGKQFAGEKFKTSTIFTKDFKYPKDSDAEFLFDFKVSAPISGVSSINIMRSKFVEFVAKVPSSLHTVYEIDRASTYSSEDKIIKITVGDLIIFKNKFGRYMVVEIDDMHSVSESEDDALNGIANFDYTIKFNFFVNTSLDQSTKDVFKPEVTHMDAPMLVFKTSVREMFNGMISRLEEMNALRNNLTESIDNETRETILGKINDLDRENKKFYLFEELNKIKLKKHNMELLYNSMVVDLRVDFALPLNDIVEKITKYKHHIQNSKNFYEVVNSIDAYEFRKNVVDLSILVDLYADQQTVLETLIDTFNYKQFDNKYFYDKLKTIKMFDTSTFVDIDKSYKEVLLSLVKKLRGLLFRIKLIINYPILADGKHIEMMGIFNRLTRDVSTGEWSEKNETDFFLLYKKLELNYGYEIGKKESGLSYRDFISDMVKIEKELFGRGMSSNDIRNISEYIQIVEKKTVEEYDDFFMIPFWLDYLEKNM